MIGCRWLNDAMAVCQRFFFNAKGAEEAQSSLGKNFIKNIFADLAPSWRLLRA
jgi:hypothetical protein